MKIIAGIIAYEEEEFIRECILSAYDWCDKIIIVEGAWENSSNFSNSPRSRDKTIKRVKELPDPLKKILYYEYNGKDFAAHRQFALDKVLEHDPDWYYKADADEIIHEDQVSNLLGIMKHEDVTCLSVTHKLFWNDLIHYETWGPIVRFFKLKDLKKDDIKLSSDPNILTCTSDQSYFRPYNAPVNAVEFYHPSYCKNTERQKLKWHHRSIEDKKPFPHIIHENGLLTRRNPKDWTSKLKKCKPTDLPIYLQDHPKAIKCTLWDSLIL